VSINGEYLMERKGFELKESCVDKRDERNIGLISQRDPSDEESGKLHDMIYIVLIVWIYHRQ